jgi:hypothetical protein
MGGSQQGEGDRSWATRSKEEELQPAGCWIIGWEYCAKVQLLTNGTLNFLPNYMINGRPASASLMNHMIINKPVNRLIRLRVWQQRTAERGPGIRFRSSSGLRFRSAASSPSLPLSPPSSSARAPSSPPPPHLACSYSTPQLLSRLEQSVEAWGWRSTPFWCWPSSLCWPRRRCRRRPARSCRWEG